MPADSVTQSIHIDAPIDKVWAALADHEAFGAWFLCRLDQPFAPGAIQTGHMTRPPHEAIRWWSKVVAMEEPRHFAFEWAHAENPTDPHADHAAAPRTLVTFRLTPAGGGTDLTVTESGFDALPEANRAARMRQNNNGWAIQVATIRAYVEG